MLEPLEGFPDNVVAIRATGSVTKADYDHVLVPLTEAAFADHDKLRVYYEIGPNCIGFEPGAMWADMRIGLGHLSRWEKVAVVTDLPWLRHATQFFSFMMPVEMKLFGLGEAATAKAWISG